MSNKIGFWSVFAIVTGSQIGSGIFILPATLAPYGVFSVLGWLISGLGAVALALVFGQLCAKFPKTGGPHVYVKEAFGSTASFFTGWTYWVISWVSTTAVIVASIGYLTPILGPQSAFSNLMMELVLLFSITMLNCKGVKTAGSAEFFLTCIKVIPLFIIPLIALFYFDSTNFIIHSTVEHIPAAQMTNAVTLLTLWGFIGLESATTAAESVENPRVTMPKAIVLGTLCVAVLYLLNTIAIMGVIPGGELMHSTAPYVDAAKVMFGGHWHLGLSIIASIICIGTLNAWMLASGQISLGLAQDGLMSSFFAKTNKQDAPVNGLFMSALGILPLLILTAEGNIAKQINLIIDFSVVAFLFVYLICVLSYIKIIMTSQNKESLLGWLAAVVALLFCSWVIYQTSFMTVGVASLFTLSGIPFYYFHRRTKT
ncbi:amino acid permease [bacterium]|nr:amino acid permease [bacterium]